LKTVSQTLYGTFRPPDALWT